MNKLLLNILLGVLILTVIALTGTMVYFIATYRNDTAPLFEDVSLETNDITDDNSSIINDEQTELKTEPSGNPSDDVAHEELILSGNVPVVNNVERPVPDTLLPADSTPVFGGDLYNDMDS